MQQPFVVVFLISLFILVSTHIVEPIVKVTSNNGIENTFLGSIEHNWHGSEFYAFRGIPYVKPPVGELRFKDPQPLSQYPSIVNAQHDGHDCPSIYATNSSENCLILNVYTKQLSANSSLPVIAFIHPGGLYLGSSLSSFIGPEYLLAHDIVLVTFNYRLGALGFLNLDNASVPGNAGFKDQVMALRWIQRYITHFGGNANDVILMGYSAGALSVTAHLVSPMSRGLFHKAIAMSGSMPPQRTVTPKDQRDLTYKQAVLMNCSTKHSEILKCLNRFTGNEIVSTLRKLFDFGKDNPIYLWLPVAESDFGQERFHSNDFYASLKSGDFQRVPLLLGSTSGEFCSSAAAILNDSVLSKRFLKEFETLAPKIFMYDGINNATTYITEALSEEYFKNFTDNSLNFEQLCDLFSDAIIRFGTDRLATFAAKFVETYVYSFEYRGRFSNFVYELETHHQRPEHMDDLMYIFKMEPHHFRPNETDGFMVELMSNFIVDFAKTGKVNTSDKLAKFPEQHLVIDSKITTIEGNSFKKSSFWNKLLPPTL